MSLRENIITRSKTQKGCPSSMASEQCGREILQSGDTGDNMIIDQNEQVVYESASTPARRSPEKQQTTQSGMMT